MKSTQQGFTLIELVMVIVILGILAATAIPRFVDLSSEAEVAALNGVQGALSSASAINYATRAARDVGGADVISTSAAGEGGVGGCNNDIAGSLLNDGMPVGYTVGYQAGVVFGDATVFGDTWGCTVTGDGGTVNWTLHYVE